MINKMLSHLSMWKPPRNLSQAPTLVYPAALRGSTNRPSGSEARGRDLERSGGLTHATPLPFYLAWQVVHEAA
ncbi:MAG: hypothetical protein PVSMB4_08760 [Ktedonobacterales bacterium]